MRAYLKILIFLLTSFIGAPAYATHIVGGEITYKCLGGNTYQVRLDLYVDCINGEPTAIQQDNPAYIGIFDAGGGSFKIVDSIQKEPNDVLVPPNFSNSCVNNPPQTCLRKVTFIKKYVLPANSKGYRIVYIRCCRNATISNIANSSELGATYFCNIPPIAESACNNSAFFKNYPPQIICINNPLVYDHSATDPDGDSLSYEFCNSYAGGAPNNPKPFPNTLMPVPITNYVSPFSSANPMGGNPVIKINPTTGIISGTPTAMGRYVVTVCCNEWRNGVLINTVKREFQFVVTNCTKAVVANIPQYSSEFNTYIVECNSNKVSFVNKSVGGFAYEWDFGVPGAGSTEFEPSYTYPDTGIYYVKLLVNKGTTCPDSITRIVKIYPTYDANFEYSGLLCPNAPVQFNDLSVATYKPVVAWEWNFGDGNISNVQNPSHVYDVGGDYNVQMVSSSIKGCVDTFKQVVNIERFVPFAGNDTIIVKGEYINFNASGGSVFTWTPPDRLNFSDGRSPRGYYPDTGMYRYNVHIMSPYGCEGDDSINVWVVGQSSLFVPSGFTPNGDGVNDVFRPLGVGYANIKSFRVVNRWGETVFMTDKFFEGWDGTYKGQYAEIGTYFWQLSITNRLGKDEFVKGDVTLIR
jgi:gliding motility-associated-like protein